MNVRLGQDPQAPGSLALQAQPSGRVPVTGALRAAANIKQAPSLALLQGFQPAGQAQWST